MKHKVCFINHQSVLLVNQEGKLKRLEVPFGVFRTGEQNLVHEVQEVLCSENDELLYMIGSQVFSHRQFEIACSF